MEQAEMARVSRTLVTLKDDVPVEEAVLSSFERKPADPNTLRDFLAAQDFKALLRRLEPILGSSADILGAAKKEARPASAPTYELVTAVTQLEEWVRKVRHAGLVSVDTETTSLDAVSAELVGISLAITEGHACYIPLSHAMPIPNACPAKFRWRRPSRFCGLCYRTPQSLK